MNLNQLEYFCTAVRCESITQAAKRLYVSQPAISGAIRELEKEFSVNLFVHARNKLILTEEGRRFYERAAALVQEQALDLALVNMGHVNPMRLNAVCIGSDHFVLVVDPAHPWRRASR